MVVTLFTTCLVIFVVTRMVGLMQRKNRFPLAGLTAIITGGSQGLGLSIAKAFAVRGANVVIVAQNIPKLEAALKEIEDKASNDKQRFLQLSYDLRSPHSAPQILDEVTEWNHGVAPDIVFNCAGNCLPGFFATSDIDTHRLQMDTIYWTCAYMAHATLRNWTQPATRSTGTPRPTRHLIFTSSCLAFFPVAGYGSYSPAKAAMRAMADTLNQEVAVYNGARAGGAKDAPETDIRIHCIFPMGIQTPGFENEEKLKPALTRKLEEDDKPQQPDELASIIVAGLEADQYMVTSNLIGNIMKGWSMGASQRTNLFDYLWTFLGTIIVLFISPDYLSKCYRWGKDKGMSSTS